MTACTEASRQWHLSGCLREHTGRNESEPMCSVVRVPSAPEDDWKRRASLNMAKTGAFSRGTGVLDDRRRDRVRKARILPKVTRMRTERLPGVAGMACMEGYRVNHGRSGDGLCPRQGNLSSGKESRIQKSEQLAVVMTTGTTQPCQSEGAVRLQHLFERMKADTVHKEVSRVNRQG